ncbi:MAG TPA: hypothetical protein VFS54_07345 [Solirubrobacterales bacterium]|nr:hypothetical protein [Solirubrobacterales bacterium]
MVRLAFVLAYLAAMAIAVILFDAGSGQEGWGLVIWAIGSVALGLGTGQFGFALLAFLAIPFAVPFGYPNHYEFSEPLPIWWSVTFVSVFSAGLILLAALAMRIIEVRRKRRPSV